MAIAFVANWTSGQFNNTTGGTLTGRTSTAGNLIVLDVNTSDTGATIADSKSNTYTRWPTGFVDDGAGWFTACYYKENCAGGASHTISITTAGGNYSVVNATEYSGIATASARDKETGATGTGTSLSSGATATLSQADELVVGFGAKEDGGNTAWTQGAGYTLRGNVTDGTAGGLGFLEDKIVAATTAVTATATHANSAQWFCGVITFKGVAAAAGVVGGATIVRQAVTRAAVR